MVIHGSKLNINAVNGNSWYCGRRIGPSHHLAFTGYVDAHCAGLHFAVHKVSWNVELAGLVLLGSDPLRSPTADVGRLAFVSPAEWTGTSSCTPAGCDTARWPMSSCVTYTHAGCGNPCTALSTQVYMPGTRSCRCIGPMQHLAFTGYVNACCTDEHNVSHHTELAGPLMLSSMSEHWFYL